MNKRIKDLAKQSDCTIDGMGYGEGDLEKFAELIVNECAAYLNGAMEVHNQAEQDLCDHAARKIKEHFGVK
jgi:hypothetical protein